MSDRINQGNTNILNTVRTKGRDTYFPAECLGIFLFALAGLNDDRILWKFLAELEHLLITALVPVLEHGGVLLLGAEGRLRGRLGWLLWLVVPVLFYAAAAAASFVWPLSKLHLEEDPKKNDHYTAVSNVTSLPWILLSTKICNVSS